MDKKLPICIVLAMLMSCFSCKQPQQPTEDADMDTQWVDSSQHLYQYGICIDSLDVKEYLMKNGDNIKNTARIKTGSLCDFPKRMEKPPVVYIFK